ncbi:ribosomal RNA small subunit methyltransferase A [Luteolibacter pohnpeiensis]|uniref:Ribosomal RNA small subunit methyltransferase A n=1 Tax=Luteolibacter pohnpeiensis TaxID=454153 RepID=A0A934SB88_9BACT|nr:16S rRNA (adenine(1518)-N(6)/adenine(1519)-N(6))-dimethyltransferase RsmA [Luteolibacter pohnpeiensis]MBK1884326.1 ribosomal RNA small subunit methyltransferase A [Luteolibacter pohnpeiensis]
MTGREIRDALDMAGVMPSRQLGQNFLIDPNMARWIVSQLDLQPDDAVVEVGPGTGALTEHVVGNVRRVILVEFDLRLATALKERFRDNPTVEVHHADGAKFDGRTLFKHRPLKFLGNLPYSSGGAIMKNLLGRPHPFERAVIMLQKEVIDRLGAKPGTKDYSVLTLRTQAFWEVRPLRTVPPEAFYPKPKIDSAVAILTPRKDELPVFDARLFDEMIRRGFAQRRKQLKKQLPAEPTWESACTALSLPATARGEELTLAQWIDLTRFYDTHPLKDLPQKAGEIFDVVDENDQVTGQSTRAEVHAQKRLHRAVHVFVFNKRGDLLLQQRSVLKDVHPGKWDSSVSGHLDSGESYEAAAVRELEEEMGISTEIQPENITKVSPSEATGWEHVHLFRTRYDGALKFPCAEVEAAMWFPIDEIAAWIESKPDDFATGFLECWKAWRSNP